MKIRLIIIILILCVPFALGELQIKKMVPDTKFETGNNIKISLNIINDYSKDVNVKIIDENIIGNNGINVKCLELTIPANSQRVYEYEPITIYKSGTFSIGPAKGTFIFDNYEKVIFSNNISIEVTGKDSNNVQGITEIYNCDGVRSISTSFSSGGSNSNFQVSFNNGLNGFNMGGLVNNPSNQIKPVVDTVKSNQLRDKIENYTEYKILEKRLIQEDYILQDMNIQEIDNGTIFDYIFKNDNKIKHIKGEINNNIITIDITNDNPNTYTFSFALLIIILSLFLIIVYQKNKPSKKKMDLINTKNNMDDKKKSNNKNNDDDNINTNHDENNINNKKNIIQINNTKPKVPKKKDITIILKESKNKYPKFDEEFFIYLASEVKKIIKDITGIENFTKRNITELQKNNNELTKYFIILDICKKAIYSKTYSKEDIKIINNLGGIK